MGTFALDIETASPFKSPSRGNFTDTEYFELVAVGVGYCPDKTTAREDIEVDVLFRDGCWDDESTKELLERVCDWVDERDGDSLITYNGERFDEHHLVNWARYLEAQNEWDDAWNRVRNVFENHIDLIEPACDQLANSQSYISLEDACGNAGIEPELTFYDDYDIPSPITESFEERYVTGGHFGSCLGERYVELKVAGAKETLTFNELESLLYHYAATDIEPLFELAGELGEH